MLEKKGEIMFFNKRIKEELQNSLNQAKNKIINLEEQFLNDKSLKEEVNRSIEETAASTNQISGNIKNIHNSMNILNESLDQSLKNAESIKQIAENLDESANNQTLQVEAMGEYLSELVAVVRQTAVSSRDKSEKATQLVDIAKDSTEIVHEAIKVINNIGSKAKSISAMIQFVLDYAMQIHVLAINTAIKAVNIDKLIDRQAAFSTISKEMNKLAKDSGEKGDQIKKDLSNILDDIENVSMIGGALNTAFEAISTESKDVAVVFEQITGAIENAERETEGAEMGVEILKNSAENLHSDALNLTVNASEIVGALGDIRNGGEEIQNGIMEINDGIIQINNAMNEIYIESTNVLKGVSA